LEGTHNWLNKLLAAVYGDLACIKNKSFSVVVVVVAAVVVVVVIVVSFYHLEFVIY
jgi:hypothetical protein